MDTVVGPKVSFARRFHCSLNYSLRKVLNSYILPPQILLSFGASPNYRDGKGLTPLYHTAIMGDDTGACISLLRYRAEFGIQDQGGWTELHHVRDNVVTLMSITEM